MPTEDRRCGTCRYWKRWQCEYPLPEIPEWPELLSVPVPAAAEITYTFMTANRGANCPCWEAAE